MTLIEGHLSSIGMEKQRTTNGAEDFFVPPAGAYEPPTFARSEQPVNQVTCARVKVFVTQDVLTALTGRQTLQVEGFHS